MHLIGHVPVDMALENLNSQLMACGAHGLDNQHQRVLTIEADLVGTYEVPKPGTFTRSSSSADKFHDFLGNLGHAETAPLCDANVFLRRQDDDDLNCGCKLGAPRHHH